MSVLLAIKRSYPYFIPRELRGGELERQLGGPVLLYLMGVMTGAMVWAPVDKMPVVMDLALASLVAIIVARWGLKRLAQGAL